MKGGNDLEKNSLIGKISLQIYFYILFIEFEKLRKVSQKCKRTINSSRELPEKSFKELRKSLVGW